MMPPDGTVHQMTSNVNRGEITLTLSGFMRILFQIMIFLENLLINKESLLELFVSKPSKEKEAAHHLRKYYMSKVIVTVMLSLFLFN